MTYNRILVATDGNDNAQRATRHALDLARQYGGELHAVYVIETRTGYDNAIVHPDTVRQNLREDGEEALRTIGTEGDPDVSVITSVREGIPHEELLSYVNGQDVDLVVMGAKGRSVFKTIREHTVELAWTDTCSVVSPRRSSVSQTYRS